MSNEASELSQYKSLADVLADPFLIKAQTEQVKWLLDLLNSPTFTPESFATLFPSTGERDAFLARLDGALAAMSIVTAEIPQIKNALGGLQEKERTVREGQCVSNVQAYLATGTINSPQNLLTSLRSFAGTNTDVALNIPVSPNPPRVNPFEKPPGSIVSEYRFGTMRYAVTVSSAGSKTELSLYSIDTSYPITSWKIVQTDATGNIW